MKNLFVFSILLLFGTLGMTAQDTLGVEKVDTQTDIAFLKSTGKPFTGIVQSRKKWSNRIGIRV